MTLLVSAGLLLLGALMALRLPRVMNCAPEGAGVPEPATGSPVPLAKGELPAPRAAGKPTVSA